MALNNFTSYIHSLQGKFVFINFLPNILCPRSAYGYIDQVFDNHTFLFRAVNNSTHKVYGEYLVGFNSVISICLEHPKLNAKKLNVNLHNFTAKKIQNEPQSELQNPNDLNSYIKQIQLYLANLQYQLSQYKQPSTNSPIFKPKFK